MGRAEAYSDIKYEAMGTRMEAPTTKGGSFKQ